MTHQFDTFLSNWYSIDLIHKSQNSPVPYTRMLHSEQSCAHFCSEWSILGYETGAFWDLWNWSIEGHSMVFTLCSLRSFARWNVTGEGQIGILYDCKSYSNMIYSHINSNLMKKIFILRYNLPYQWLFIWAYGVIYPFSFQQWQHHKYIIYY